MRAGVRPEDSSSWLLPHGATVLALAAPETAPFRGAPLCSLAYRWQCPRKLLLFPGSLGRHRPSREFQEIGLFVTVWINPPKNDIYPGLG